MQWEAAVKAGVKGSNSGMFFFLIDLIFSALWNWLFISAWMHSAVCDTLCCFALPAVLCLPTFVEK